MEQGQTCTLLLVHVFRRFSMESSGVQPEQLGRVSVQPDMQPLHSSVSSPGWTKSFAPLRETPCRSVTGLAHGADLPTRCSQGRTQSTAACDGSHRVREGHEEGIRLVRSGEPPSSLSLLFPISFPERLPQSFSASKTRCDFCEISF